MKLRSYLAVRLRALAGWALLCGAVAAGAAAEPASAGDEKSSWWTWWSWADGLLGFSFGGVAYGDPAQRVTGSDKLVHEARALSGVRGIEVRGPIDIVLRQGGEERVTVHTDDNVAPLIQTLVEDGVLRIGVRPGAGFRSKHAVGVTVQAPRVDTVRMLGSGDVTCAHWDADALDLALSGPGKLRIDDVRAARLSVALAGPGDMVLSGAAERFESRLEGSGSLDASELVARDVRVDAAGSGSARVWSTVSLDARISGAGGITYRGQPRLSTSLNGTGRLVHE